MIPRLTIGIPTRNRPEMVRRAIDSALAQTVPVRIVVNDSGACNRTQRTCEDLASRSPVAGHDFEYIQRDGGSLWENWKHVARQADGEFFMWLQDDDVISPYLAERIVEAFDRYPKAQVYCSRLTFSYDGRLGCSFYGSWGPKLHLDVLRMRPSEFSGTLLPIVAYFDTWAQSPAKAFRVGNPFQLMLDSLPDGCDMYTERLDIAFMGMHGTAIADPNVAGLSVLHKGNESLLTTKEAWAQSVIFHKFLDMMVELIPDWHDEMFEYFNMPGIHKMLQSFYNDMSLNVELSENCKAIFKMVGGVLRAINGMPIIRDEEPATTIIENEFGRFQVPIS
jgi:glycosyltransferase involved in cell wall biosynthesis